MFSYTGLALLIAGLVGFVKEAPAPFGEHLTGWMFPQAKPRLPSLVSLLT